MFLMVPHLRSGNDIRCNTLYSPATVAVLAAATRGCVSIKWKTFRSKSAVFRPPSLSIEKKRKRKKKCGMRTKTWRGTTDSVEAVTDTQLLGMVLYLGFREWTL